MPVLSEVQVMTYPLLPSGCISVSGIYEAAPRGL
jgi:hypothetical protein